MTVMLTQNTDTICAVSTPAGVGGVAMIRVSGPEAITLTDSIWRGARLTGSKSHTAHLGNVMDGEEILDQAVCTVYRAPGTFTGEDVAEICVHGSVYVQQRLLEVLIQKGCRMAGPGEFTRRAFAAGRFDLAQAEAVADVIASTSKASHRIAVNQMRGTYSRRLSELRDALLELCTLLELELDFSEEKVEFASRKHLLDIARQTSADIAKLAHSFRQGNAIKNGVPVAIIGHTNAGKSTLLNTLVGEERAIVSDIHGTTRDFIEDTLNINGILFRIIDTAGLRATDDAIESIGIERSRRCAEKAMIVIWLIDATAANPIDDFTRASVDEIAANDDGCTIICAINKSDAAEDKQISATKFALGKRQSITISAKTGEGVEELKNALLAASGASGIGAEDVMVTNARHYESLIRAQESITRTIAGIEQNLPGDLVAQDLRETITHLSSITGQITSTDILQNIFGRFCIGK